ncbi:hypothetical protein LG275_12735 [Chryseomicrobium palamuruense]
MPLPLIPIIVAGASVVSTAIAAKKGTDSYRNMKETKEIAKDLEKAYSAAYEKFESQKVATNLSLEYCGELKLNILDTTMHQFVETFQQIKNVSFDGQAITEEFVADQDIEQLLVVMEKQVVEAGQVLKAGIASLASGGLAAMGALGATTTFAAASTGTTIATLSGIAAQNATLAFLGGGSLAAGGFGIAGGTMVLGGIALAPALAIGSLIFSASTEKKLNEMYERKAEVEVDIEKLKSATNAMQAIKKTTNSLMRLATKLQNLFDIKIVQMKNLIKHKGTDFSKYSFEEQQLIYINYKAAVVMKEILNTTLLDSEGTLIPSIKMKIKELKSSMKELEG